MKHILLPFLLVTFLCSASGFSQSQKPLATKTSFLKGVTFYQDGKRINSRTVELTLRKNQEAFQLYQKSNSLANGSSLISAIGAVLIGWPVGTAITGGEPNWGLAGIGGATIVVSFVIYFSSKKKARQAIETYNAGLNVSEYNRTSTSINLLLIPTELGFSISF